MIAFDEVFIIYF